MNARERFLSVLNFEPVDRTMMWEIGAWVGAIRRWYGEGLPERYGVSSHYGDGQSCCAGLVPWDPTPTEKSGLARDVIDYLKLDRTMERIPVNNYFNPAFEEEIYEDHGDWMVMRDINGVVRHEWKDRTSVPHFVSWPVKSWDDWEQIKAERLNPSLEGRLPADWSERVAAYKTRDYPVVAGLRRGFYWTARDLLGDEGALWAFADQPELVRDIMNTLCDFWVSIYDDVLDDVQADALWIWEDISYKNGSLISPAMVREFILPCYQKLTACVRDHGVRIVAVDTDGDCRKLIPIFQEGGINTLLPFEVNSGMDVAQVREAFPDLAIIGGVDKTQLSHGKAEIDAELARRLTPEMLRGGYIPAVDHQVPMEVSWENFKYYRERVEEICSKA